MGRIELLSGAENDLLEIFSSLFDRDPDLANQFSNSVHLMLENLSVFPELGPCFLDDYRRCLVPGFHNYGAFYVIESQRVFVHAILDLRRDPSRIEERLGG